MNEQKNLVLAILLSIMVLVGWQYLFPPKRIAPSATPQTQSSVSTTPAAPPGTALPGGVAPPPVMDSATQAAILMAQPRVHFSTPEMHGSFSLIGGRLDDLSLTRYHETIDPKSPEIRLLAPASGAGAYYAEFGWVPANGTAAPLPGADTKWQADSDTLGPDHPVTFTYDNGAGLKFSRTYAVDSGSMFTITDKVENTGSGSVSLYPYALISRWGTPKVQDIYVLHEGPLGVLDGTLKETKYKKLREDEHLIEEHTTGGWLGITDKYWLAALVPDQSEAVLARISWHNIDNLDRYQTDWLGPVMTVEAGANMVSTSRFFAGAKELARLDAYAKEYNIPRFDLAIDFGWFYFLTKPFFYFLRMIHAEVPNFGIAIMIFTIVIKGAFFPIANKSFQSMNKMRKLQPQVKELQARYADDKPKLNQEMMALYKREGANPISGCLPMVIQIPVFFALYKVLYVTIEMRQAPFFGWIHDLSVPDPTSFANLFGLIPWTPPDFLHVGVWPFIMGITMFLQQKMTPQPTVDPMQAKIMSFLPLIFTFMMAKFPAGLVIYWAWSNLLTVGQQWLIMKTAKK